MKANEEWQMTKRHGCGTAVRLISLIMFAGAAFAASAADPSQYSEAERQLFVRPHLDNVASPARLHYRYQRSGSLESEVSDRAVLSVAQESGARTAEVDYLSAERKLELPSVDQMEGNPIILHFLEREVRELKRLTGGAVGFYRSRIRKALAGNATVRPTEVDYGGKRLKAVEIRIDPYVDDPARSRFQKFADRYYVMVLSPEIPGEVYQLKAELPVRSGGPAPAGQGAGQGSADQAARPSAGHDAAKVIHAEVLTFERQEPGR
jgi:hypothetical protein